MLQCQRTCKHTSEFSPRSVRVRERDCLLEAVGHRTAKAVWLVEKTGQ